MTQNALGNFDKYLLIPVYTTSLLPILTKENCFDFLNLNLLIII